MAQDDNVRSFNPHRGLRWGLGLLLAVVAVGCLAAFLDWLRHAAHEAPLPAYLTNAPVFHRHR